MHQTMQTTVSFLFFLGSILVSIVAVQGVDWSNLWKKQSSSSSDDVPWVSQNFEENTNKFINTNIIPNHQHMSYEYLMMASYFSRADVALPGFAKYFRAASDREMANVNLLVDYINKRGGHVGFRDVKRPGASRWVDGVEALAHALELERTMNHKLLKLHEVASNVHDVHLKHIVEDKFIEPKVELIKHIADHLAVLEKMKGEGYGLGEYMFDKNL